MPFYQRLGDVPRKRHIQFRDNGTLLTEEVMGMEGFVGMESILYHLQSPCRVMKVGDFKEIEREEITMAEMIERLRNMVRSAGELNLVTFFERAGSRRGLVVAFLSVLELVRMSEISLVQRETFGEIIARATNPA